MYCKECGTQIMDNVKFCKACGTPQFTTSGGLDSSIHVEEFNEGNSETAPHIRIQQYPAKQYYEATVIGGILMIVSFVVYINPGLSGYSLDEIRKIQALDLIIRLLCTVWAVSIAKKIKRNTFLWGILALAFTPITLFIIGLIKSK